MDGHEFAREAALALGGEPLTDEEANALLAMAGVAAHASERLAAPLCTYLAGRSGRSLEDVRAIIDRLAARA
jgi:hypothetical protein